MGSRFPWRSHGVVAVLWEWRCAYSKHVSPLLLGIHHDIPDGSNSMAPGLLSQTPKRTRVRTLHRTAELGCDTGLGEPSCPHHEGPRGAHTASPGAALGKDPSASPGLPPSLWVPLASGWRGDQVEVRPLEAGVREPGEGTQEPPGH